METGISGLKLQREKGFVFAFNCMCRLHMAHGASLVAQTVKNLPAVQETWVRSLGWEDPLEEGMAMHTSILVWRIPWTEEPGGLQLPLMFYVCIRRICIFQLLGVKLSM